MNITFHEMLSLVFNENKFPLKSRNGILLLLTIDKSRISNLRATFKDLATTLVSEEYATPLTYDETLTELSSLTFLK